MIAVALAAAVFTMSVAVPAMGGPTAFSAATLASKVKKALKKSKKANKTAKLADAKATEALAKAPVPGPKGDPGATGPRGPQGIPGPLLATLTPGKTLKGAYSVGGTAAGGSEFSVQPISFTFPLASDPAVHVVEAGATAPAACPGTSANPAAAPGALCVYEAFDANSTFLSVCDNVTDGCGNASRFGGLLQVFSSAAGVYFSSGTWAVTAPTGSTPRAAAQTAGGEAGQPNG